MKQPPKTGERRIVKHFAIYKTIPVGRCNSFDKVYVKLLFDSYYVLEEFCSTNMGHDWMPVEYALIKEYISSPTTKQNIPV